jgi:parvulin-like peptidyl-prolyl isomerase
MRHRIAGRNAVAGIVALALAAAGLSPRAAVIEEIAASVNGQIITRSELLERENQVMAQLSSRYVGDELDQQVERMRKTLLTDMIREMILLQRAEILGLELDKVFQQALTQLKEQQKIKTQEELDQILKQEGISKDELRQTLLRFNVPDIMINLEVREKITAGDDEVADYFEKHKEEFRVEESFTVQEIVLTPEGRTVEELQKLAATVEDEVKAGTAFNELVVKYSQAPSRFKDGEIGPFKRGDLSSEIESAALALKPGEVSAPITTKAGVHIIKLKTYVAPKDPSLEDARKDVIAKVKQDKFSAALEKYFKMLLENNRVEVNPLYRQYDQRS